ncbi:tripartite tricarboxylate transporter TctB family protein [Salibacterium aidingense]|uniref:tripartite tricarboxylate transporter TctB family protein n=1 Tax=Salibacterium aidingense TaxID=384933 RepID=UPI003BE9514A
MSFIKQKDFIVGIVIAILLFLLYLSTLELADEVRLFPLIIIGIASVNVGWMILKSIVSKKEKESSKFFNSYFFIIVSALFLYYFSLTIIGFYVSSVIFIFLLFIYLNPAKNVFAYMKGLTFSVVFGASLYMLFHVSLNLVTPTGLLF